MVILVPILVFVAFLLICALMTVGQPLNPTRPLMPYEQAREYARRLQKLIGCKTISHEAGYEEEFARLEKTMEELFPLVHRKSQKLTVGACCWIYSLPGQDREQNILLMAHHDVFPAEGDWKQDPFSGCIAEGKIWGRGTVSHKTSLFAIFSALEELLTEGVSPGCNVWIASSCDKETEGTGIQKAAAYFRENGITFDFVLDEGGAVIDAPISSMTCPKCAMVAIHEKGTQRLILTAQELSTRSGLGAGLHSTPTERMAEFIAEFRRDNRFIRRMTPELEAMLKTLAPYMAFPMRVALANLWFFKPFLMKRLPNRSPQAAEFLGTTCAFNDLVTEEGGKRCTARIVLRCMDGGDLQTDLTQLRTLATKHGIRVELVSDIDYHAPSDPKHPAFTKVSRCIREVFPDVPVIPYILPGTTDARHLTELAGCVLRFAPLRLTDQQLASIHGENENVDITAVGTAVIFYRRLLESYATAKVTVDMDDELEEDEEFLEEALPEEIPVEETAEPVIEEAVDFDFGEIGAYPPDNIETVLPEEPDDPLADLPEDLLEGIDMDTLEKLSDEEYKELSNWEDIL